MTKETLGKKLIFTPRERFLRIWGSIIFLLIIPYGVFRITALYSYDALSFFERMFEVFLIFLTMIVAGVILYILGWLVSKTFSGDTKDASLDSEMEKRFNKVINMIQKYLSYTAGRAETTYEDVGDIPPNQDKKDVSSDN